VKLVLETGTQKAMANPDPLVEEILRFDPALHMFTRWAYSEVEVMGHTFQRGDQVGLLLAMANRDAGVWDDPLRFDPTRSIKPHTSFGAGVHFCVGAPLARLELRLALPILFDRRPDLALAEAPHYADVYHFHGLQRLMVV
jgi:unspecific monooxygenase